MQIGAATMKNSMEVPQNLKIELPYDPANPLLDIYPDKTIFRKNTDTPMFITALFTIAKTWKQPRCPSIDDWFKKMWGVCVCVCVCVCV